MFKLPISKFKNAAPKIVKKEQIVNGVSTNRLLNTIGSLINSSLDYVTFAYDTSSGGSVCTLTHEFMSQRKTFSSSNSSEFCTTHAHAGPMTDIQYSPFQQDLLATCGFDSQIQLWRVELSSENGVVPVMNRSSALQLNESRCDCVLWNPNVNNVIASCSLGTIYLWDVTKSAQLAVNRTHGEAVQGLTWKRDGSMMASIAKDKVLQVFDPRKPSEGIRIENSKTSNKDSRLEWLGTSDLILSSVFTPSFQREIQIWDVRNLTDPVHCSMLDTGNNVLTPLYDQDSSVLFLAGKAETTIRYCEVLLNGSTDSTNFVCNSVQSVDDQVKGVCLVPKFGMDIMKCEIDRLLLLTRSSVYPLPYFVPRRSYYDFYGEIYPDTQCIFTPGVETSDWASGANGPIVKVPLNPDAQKKTLARLGKQVLVDSSNVVETPKTTTTPAPVPVEVVKPPVVTTPVVKQQVETPKPAVEVVVETKVVVETPKPTVTFRNQQTPSSVVVAREDQPQQPKVERSVSSRPKSSAAAFYQSKFKYIDGKPAHKSEHITNLRNLSTMWTSECNGFQVNSKRAAFILSSPSGQIGIVELNKMGRLQDTGNFCLINKSKVADFEWDPFDEEVIAVACDDGQVRVWRIPADGLESTLEEPEITLRGHQEKLLCIKYHPYARNVLASASFDKSIKIWNIDDQTSPKTLTGNTDTIFSMSWSRCGSRLACICKDGMIRLYEPLVSEQPYLELKCGPEPGSKAARIQWVLDDTSILVSGFGKGNARKIYLFDATNLSLLHLEDINQSPSLLIPHFDQDINVLYLFAKGEETLYLYEVLPNEPYFQTLSPYKPDGLHFALGFLPKRACDVRTAEIGKAYRLTKDNRIEKISFTVPRVKLGLFQDDLFPDTLDLAKPYLSAKQWFVNQKINLRYLNLQPSDLQKLSDAPVEPPKPVKKVMPDVKNNADNFSQSESMVINAMLQRTTLFKNDSDDGSDSEWT